MHLEYVDFIPDKEKILDPEVFRKKIIKTSRGHRYEAIHEKEVAEYGWIEDAIFRGVEGDIRKLHDFFQKKEIPIKKINDFIYQIKVSESGDTKITVDSNMMIDAIKTFPGLKVVVFTWGRYESYNLGSESGYDAFTSVNIADYHEKEEWYSNKMNPHKAGLDWDEMDYVVVIDGKVKKMTRFFKTEEIEGEFTKKGAKISKINPIGDVFVLPETIFGERIVEVSKYPFCKIFKEIRAPFLSIESWPHEKSRELLVVGYAHGLREGMEFDQSVVSTNNEYLRRNKDRYDELTKRNSVVRELIDSIV